MQLPQSWTLNRNWKGIFRGSTLHIYSWHYTQEGPTLNELAILQCLPCTLSLAYTEFVLSQPHHVCIFMLLHALLCEFAIAMKIELIEWARSWVQPQHCKSKTTNTTTQRRTHKAFPKSQLMSSPSLVPPYFTLSLYIIPALPVTATICNRITTRSTVFTHLGISTAWLFPAQRPSNDFVWIWMNSNSILKLLSFQLRWETLHFLAATDLSPEATSWILSCSLNIQRISRYILNRSLPCDWRLPWQWRWMMTRCTLVGCCDKASHTLWLTSSRIVFFRVLEAEVESESYKVGSN